MIDGGQTSVPTRSFLCEFLFRSRQAHLWSKEKREEVSQQAKSFQTTSFQSFTLQASRAKIFYALFYK